MLASYSMAMCLCISKVSVGGAEHYQYYEDVDKRLVTAD